MATYTIKGGLDSVTVKTDEHGVLIEYGMDAINATIALDYGEARELAQAIFEGAEEQGLVTLDLMPNGFMVSSIPEDQAMRRIP